MTLGKIITPETVVAVGLSVLTSYGTFVGWKAEANLKITKLEEKVKQHDAARDDLIALTSDVRAIKESVDRIESYILPTKKGSLK